MAVTNDHCVRLTGRDRLSDDTFELRFERPPAFVFRAGQKIRFFHLAFDRDYTLINGPDQDELAVCVRQVAQGRYSPYLIGAPLGTAFHISAPFGYFTYQSTSRTAVFIATGTGIAPFVAFVRAAIVDYYLLHGVRSATSLYYRKELAAAARVYVPCLTAETIASPAGAQAFGGRVTAYLENHLPAGDYDFYLCGRGEMITAAIDIIDRRFPGSLVFSEWFY